eukprot:SAG22_NODE_768_length_7351_cov_27.969939_5_plen_284_part_00
MCCCRADKAGATQLLSVCGKDGSCTVYDAAKTQAAPVAVKKLKLPNVDRCVFRAAIFVELGGGLGVCLLTAANTTVGKVDEGRLVLWSTEGWEQLASLTVFKKDAVIFAMTANSCAMAAAEGGGVDAKVVGVGSSEGLVAACKITVEAATKTPTISLVCEGQQHGMGCTSVALVPSREDGSTAAATTEETNPAAAAAAPAAEDAKDGGDDAEPAAGHPPLVLSISLDQTVRVLPVVQQKAGGGGVLAKLLALVAVAGAAFAASPMGNAMIVAALSNSTAVTTA